MIKAINKKFKKIILIINLGFMFLILFAVVPAMNNQYIAPKRFIKNLKVPLKTINNLNAVDLNQEQLFLKNTFEAIFSDSGFLKWQRQRFLPYTKTQYDFEIPIQYFIIVDIFTQIEDDKIIEHLKSLAISKKVLSSTDIKDSNKKVEVTLKSSIDYSQSVIEDDYFKEDFKYIDKHSLAAFINYFEYINGTSLPNSFSEVIKLKDGDMVYPFETIYPITANIGWYKPFGKRLFHDGIDLGAGCGEKTYNVMEGYVIAIYSSKSSCGNGIEILGKDNVKVKYCHFQNKIDLSIGAKLNKGDLIGYVGTTGLSTGCHLHISVKKDDNLVNFCEVVNCNN